MQYALLSTRPAQYLLDAHLQVMREIFTEVCFKFKKEPSGKLELLIGTKKYNLGVLKFKAQRSFKVPNSLYIKKHHGKLYPNDKICLFVWLF